MKLLPIAIVASWLAQSVAAEIPNKYLSVGLLSIVCQNDAKKADEDFYVFSKEGDSWISIVGNVTSIHETAEGFTLKLSNSPHETSFLRRTDEGYNLVNFDKGEVSKRVCTDLTLLSAALKKSMFDLADKAYAKERQADSTKIDDLKLRLQLLQTKNAEQDEALVALSARAETDRAATYGTIDSLNNDLRAMQAKKVGLKADLMALNERYEAERLGAANSIGILNTDLLALQSENASQQKELAALATQHESVRASTAGEIAGLKADLTALNERYVEERTIGADTIEKLKIETRNYKQIISKSTQTILILENSLSNSENALEKIYGMQSQPSGEAADELTLNIKLYSEALTNAMQNMSELRTEFVNLEIIFGQEADLLAMQSKNASQQAALSELTARYDGLRTTSTATIGDLQDEARLLQAKINAQVTRLESLNAESSKYQNALLASTQAIAELRAELAKTREAAAQAKAALEQDADGLKKRLAAALMQKLADDAEQEGVRAKLAAALAAKLAAEQTNADQMTEAETRAALLSEARKTLFKEKAVSAKARREMALLNQQVAALRTQLQNLQGLLDDAMAKDVAEEVQLQNLGTQLNSALARVAAEERKRRRLEEAERKRLEREALELQGQANTLSSQAKDLEKYRSEFFGRLRDVLGQQDGVRIVGDRFVFASEVLFPPGGANLSSAGKQEMAKVAEILKSVAGLIPEEINWIIRVDGHTDDTKVASGSRYADNWHLSQARALSVVRYFANTLDIPPNRLAANGFGEYQPVNTENTPDARAQNRRIELKFTEK